MKSVWVAVVVSSFFYTGVLPTMKVIALLILLHISPFFYSMCLDNKQGIITVFNILETTLEKDNAQNVSKGWLEQVNKDPMY